MNGNLVSTLSPGFSSTAFGKVAIVLAGTLLLAVSAKVQVPFWPVPMTMQTFVVLVIAMACGSFIGGSIVLTYLIEGALGLPVFAGAPGQVSGIGYLVGPTGGYLVGMLVASIAVGQLSVRGWDRSVYRTLAAMIIGTFVIFTFGYVWLSTWVGAYKAWSLGVMPFILSEGLKITLAALTLPAGWSLLRRARSERRK